MYADSRHEIFATLARAFAPRVDETVSEWADNNIVLSTKESPEAGPWRTDRNPLLREPMDCMSTRSTVRQLVLMWPIQMGKTMVERHGVAYRMVKKPGPMLIGAPSEVSREKLVDQKYNTMLETTGVIQDILKTSNSRDSANRRFFKDYLGGQIYFEHAGTPGRLKSLSVRDVFVDEFTDFALELKSGDDPVRLIEGRTSAFPSSSLIVYISTPGIEGFCRISKQFEQSDQRRYHVPCPDCGGEQTLEWENLKYEKADHTKDDHDESAWYAWYVCTHCGAVIDEKHKTDMIKKGRWIPAYPGRPMRGYTCNCLYYPIGLGPRWAKLVVQWREAQHSQATLKTFFNDRLALAWFLPELRKAQLHTLADRAENYPLRAAPLAVLGITGSVDTQDDRLEVQLTGWGEHMQMWVLDYHIIPGDPADDATWAALADYINTPIQRADGKFLPVSATLIDAGGHRTHAVYNFVRARQIARPIAGFGAKDNRAPALGRPKAQDVIWRGLTDKHGVHTRQVGTVYCKKWLIGEIAVSADRDPGTRTVHFSEQLPLTYFEGLVSEFYAPETDRYKKKKAGIRNEPLDLCVYGYAAAHHEDLNWHKRGMERWPAPIDVNKPEEKKKLWIPKPD